MAAVSAKMVKELRDKSGAGFMDCKKALVAAGGDMAKAEIALRERGMAIAKKKSGRAANEGVIGSYVHAGSKLGQERTKWEKKREKEREESKERY